MLHVFSAIVEMLFSLTRACPDICCAIIPTAQSRRFGHGRRSLALCGSNPRFYTGLGIGDPGYVYLYGVLVVADDVAGILWIVESD